MTNLSGAWVGEIDGTNKGGVFIRMIQDGIRLSGEARINEPKFGTYACTLQGTVEPKPYFFLVPKQGETGGLNLGNIEVYPVLMPDGQIRGEWKSTQGTAGVFTLTKAEVVTQKPAVSLDSVFIVHGHDDAARSEVARFLERLGLVPVILNEQANKGGTIIEKIENYGDGVHFAVVLLTPDDMGYPVGGDDRKQFRARQNVVLELGYFMGKIGRARVAVLLKGTLDFPSDVLGIGYTAMDNSSAWKLPLARELKAAGFPVDFNKLC